MGGLIFISQTDVRNTVLSPLPRPSVPLTKRMRAFTFAIYDTGTLLPPSRIGSLANWQTIMLRRKKKSLSQLGTKSFVVTCRSSRSEREVCTRLPLPTRRLLENVFFARTVVSTKSVFWATYFLAPTCPRCGAPPRPVSAGRRRRRPPPPPPPARRVGGHPLSPFATALGRLRRPRRPTKHTQRR